MALVKYNNNSLSSVTSAAGFPAGAMTLISTTTASSDSTISITSGIDSTYPIYVFKFINIHPATDDVHFQFQADTGTNTNYNQAITTTTFNAIHFESDSSASMQYSTNLDQAQGTAFQILSTGIGNDNDQDVCGELKIFNPSSSTFVKHFIYNGHNNEYRNASYNQFVAGYINTTTAITRFQFKMGSGNMDAGTIKLYGIKDS
tara:strand:+ start:505 stop:1113 length:609 start_codon:yes stop_codon:yes gene_type:complete